MLNLERFEGHLDKLLKRNKAFHGIAIVDKEGLLYKKTFSHYKAEALHPVFSITKSLTAWLALIALDDLGLSPEAVKVVSVLPRGDWPDLLSERPHLAQLNLGHLLNMRAGFHWPEIEAFYDAGNPFRQFLAAQDPIRFLLSRDFDGLPGYRTTYNSAVSHLLGLCIASLTGQALEDYAYRKLFMPLGIESWTWEKDAGGNVYGGHGLSLSLEALTALAQVLVGQGYHRLSRIMPENVILQLQRVEKFPFRGYAGYGNGMWLVESGGHSFISAFGHGGQRLYWSPTLALAIVFVGRVKPEFGLQEQLIGALFNQDRS